MNPLLWLRFAARETDERQKRLAQLNMRSIEAYNAAIANARRQGLSLSRRVQTGFDRRTGEPQYAVTSVDAEPMPFLVIVVEELADLMTGHGREVEDALRLVASGGRMAGVHVVAGTQRPTADVLTGRLIGAMPARICYRVATRADSRTVMGDAGAEALLGLGDLLFADGEGETLRVHGPHVAEDEVERVAADLARQGRPRYEPAVTADVPQVSAAPAGPHLAEDGEPGPCDPTFERALALFVRDPSLTPQFLQARLGIGREQAAEIHDRLMRTAR